MDPVCPPSISLIKEGVIEEKEAVWASSLVGPLVPRRPRGDPDVGGPLGSGFLLGHHLMVQKLGRELQVKNWFWTICSYGTQWMIKL